MTLVVHSKEEGDVAFLTFSEDELYAMGCAEEGMLRQLFVFPTCR